MWQHAPSGVLKPSAGDHSIELHKAQRDLIRDSTGQLISHMQLVVGGSDRALEFLRSHGPIIQMLFQRKPQRRKCLVLVHMNLERILGTRADGGEVCQQREEAAFQAAMLARSDAVACRSVTISAWSIRDAHRTDQFRAGDRADDGVGGGGRLRGGHGGDELPTL